MEEQTELTTREAADLLEVGTETILRYIWSGKLPGSRLRHGAKRLGYLIPYESVIGLRDGSQGRQVQDHVSG
jgi:excisionase family DNA binding protein